MKTEVWQKEDGTVYKKIDGHWFYLSPLFGEWLQVFDKEPERDKLKPYPYKLPSIETKNIRNGYNIVGNDTGRSLV